MDRLKAATFAFFQIAVVWLIILLALRIVEVVWNGFTNQFPPDLGGFLLWSFFTDFLFWLKWLLTQYLIFLLLFLISRRLGKVVFEIYIILMTVLYIVLIQYFKTSLVPLGADLYGYSLEDIAQTVGASGGVSILSILGILLTITLVVFMLLSLPRRIKSPLWLAVALPAFSLFLMAFKVYDQIHVKVYPSDFANNLMLNKADHFFKTSYSHFYPDDEEVDIYADAYIGDYESSPSITTKPYRYIGGKEYPFFRELDNQDVLSAYFNQSSSKPNIVIILVEGLGRAFTNEGAYLGNFTPFLDSLANKGLYWKNFLSAGGRTFAVLPSIMASLPFATNGFLELGNKMPDHLSLFNLLKASEYRTGFYYGGDASFDNMSMFLKKNKVDKINDQASFPPGYEKLPAANGFTWGYSDKDLFNHYLSSSNAEVTSPHLSVILTVATHNPFLIKNQQKYIRRFEQRMNELAFEDVKKDTYKNYRLQYSSIMYTDEALSEFFNAYKRRADFKNTIFLITGDHRMPEIPMSTKIDRYHVPLIIYSPLLKRTARFSAISTHFDIAPSLLAYLGRNYEVQIPKNASWLGNGLDTARNFRNIQSYPLIQTKTDIIDFVMNQYHINGSNLYELNENLEEQSITDQVVYREVKTAFESFKRRNSTLGKGAKILPDSVLKKYLK